VRLAMPFATIGVIGVCLFSPTARADGFVPTKNYQKRTVEGWTVYVNKQLLNEQSELGKQALRLLEVKLYEMGRLVPERACRELRNVPIWLGVNDGHAPCAEYHPSREWLVSNGYNPDKAKSVEIGNAKRFLTWSIDQPMMILHELAHAYMDRVLKHDDPAIKAAFDAAVQSKIYDSVLRANGKTERAYAMTNPDEYFAEATEAYFGENDFYPFVKAELKVHDPRLFGVLEKAWRVEPNARSSEPDARNP
jgi:hypothetical protein